MKIPEFLEDLNIISKLGDNPGADNGLTAEGLKAKFDEGTLALQRFINSVLIAKLNEIFVAGGQLNEGLIMTGPINMNLNKLFGLADPENDSDAVSLGYAKKNYAPSNYGYGGTMQYVSADTEAELETKLDTILDTLGARQAKQISVNCPEINPYIAICTLRKTSDGYATLEYVGFNPDSNVCVVRKSKFDNVWKPAEYENPALVAGKKYRTTERYNNKPVFAQLIEIANLPNTSTLRVEIGVAVPLQVYGYTKNSRTLPHGDYIKLRSGYGYVEITTTMDYSADSATIVVKHI